MDCKSTTRLFLTIYPDTFVLIRVIYSIFIRDNSYLTFFTSGINWVSFHYASYRKILWSLEGARFGFTLFQSLWKLTGTSAAVLPRCLSNFRAILSISSEHPISRLRDFTRFGGKTSYHLVNRGPGLAKSNKAYWMGYQPVQFRVMGHDLEIQFLNIIAVSFIPKLHHNEFYVSVKAIFVNKY